MSNIDALCADWLDAKSAETAANKRRIEIEDQLAQALDIPDEGSKTHNLDSYKVTVTQPVTRKIDESAWKSVKHLVPENLHPVKVKVEADGTGCKYLANNEPDMWKKIASAFTSKPGKIGVKVEKL